MVEWDTDLETILADAGVADEQIVAARGTVAKLIAEQERKAELVEELARELNRTPGIDEAWESSAVNDVYVAGRLSVIMEFAQLWRSEIEELG